MVVKRKLKLTKVLRRKQKLLKRALLKTRAVAAEKRCKKEGFNNFIRKRSKNVCPQRWVKGGKRAKANLKGRGAKAYFVYLIMPRLFIFETSISSFS